MNKRPNIIIFNPDEMRADAMSHLGNPAAMTPIWMPLPGRMRFPLKTHSARIRSASPAGAAFLPGFTPMSTATVP